MLMESISLKDRILLENIPSGKEYLHLNYRCYEART
jgi:hypothetical protein